jgi:hypothetical protein
MAKKWSKDEKIIEAMETLDMFIRNLDAFRNKYDDYIDEAVLCGDDARARQLIKQKIRVSVLIRQFKTFRSDIMLGACTMKAESKLYKLSAIIAEYKGRLTETLNSELEKSNVSFYVCIEKLEAEIEKFNKEFAVIPIGSIPNRLNEIPEDEIQAELRDHIPGRMPVQRSKEIDITDNIDYKGIVDEENKKGIN